MDPGASSTIEMPALGRPFGLGMLYDCRRDILVPGLTFWDRDDLKKHTGEITKPSSDFEIVASESIEGKSSALNVEASLRASFLGGLVEVEGSAKYLNDSKTSKNQARVTLKYKTTTKFNELSMNHLGRGNMKHSYVFDKKEATHVVTGILYGAQAFFVFDREVTAKEDHQDIEGNLKVMIKKIPLLAIEGEGSLKMEDKEKANADKFSCKFHGDFCLKKTPTTFHDAIEVYKSLPQLLGANGENAVPVKVWLLPLTSLDSDAAKLVRQISIRLVQETQSVLEDFNEVQMRCNDAVGSFTAQQFPQINKKLRSFREMCSEFKLELQQKLATKLPLIRGGGAEEAELADILMKRHASPFNSKSLSEWMDCKEKEISMLKSLTNNMKNTKVVSSQSILHEELLSVEHAVCFVFTSLGRAEPYLSDLSNYLKGKTKPADQDPHTRDVEQQQWFQSYKLADEMMKQVKLFSDFAEANKDDENVKFLAQGLTNESKTDSSIFLYKEGLYVTEDFKPPSKPEAVTVADISHKSVTVKISPPKFGAENITSYSVEYCVSGKDDWEQSESKAEEVPVDGLRPNTEYVFRCRAVTSVGVGPANQDSARTFPCSPPDKLHVDANSHEISVSWEKPAELGQDVLILSYIVEYATSTNGEQVEDNQWKQTMATSESTILTGLQAETKYVIRVTCDCGADGRSRPSVILNVSTTKREFGRLAEYLKHCGKIETSTLPQVFKIPLEEEDREIDWCHKFTFGKESMRQKRTIMLLGETGSGKTTLINGMINYIVGVGWQDEFRFIIGDDLKSQAHDQTSEVTVYKINHQDGFTVPFSLTIVDTPGFGDTRGIDRDWEIVQQLRTFFSSDCGVNEIDAICFVAQASLARFTAKQKYVFDSVLSIFGKDMAENIQILVTFADGRHPPVLEAIRESGIPCPKNSDNLPIHFKFNNLALFAHNKSAQNYDDDDEIKDGGFYEIIWEFGTRSMKRFFAALNFTQAKSLKLTKKVIKEQQQLEVSVENLQVQVSPMEKVKYFLSGTSSGPKRLCEAVKSKSKKLESHSGPLPVYIVPLQEKNLNINGCQYFKYGKKSSKPNRTIMVLGATGAGKSTLINGMINHILGVKWDDSFRLKLVDEDPSKSQADSQTSEVTVYKINHQDGSTVEFSLTIVDTPGFGDTRGIDRDREIVEQLRTLFSSDYGVIEFDAICFVVQASLARLTATQKYVFDSVLSIFGKDVAENIRILVTFADGQRPPVLEAINESGVPCPKNKDNLPLHFKFNNSALFAHNKSAQNYDDDDDDDDESEDGGFDKMFWEMGTKSMKRFFAALNLTQTKSLKLTKEVLKERQQLEVSVENLQVQVRLGLAKLQELKETREWLKKRECGTHDRRRSKEYNMTVDYELVQNKVVALMEESAKCLNRLKEIALKPNPLSTPEYIEMLIEGEKNEAKPGWKQRVHALNSMKEKAEFMAKVEKNEKIL